MVPNHRVVDWYQGPLVLARTERINSSFHIYFIDDNAQKDVLFWENLMLFKKIDSAPLKKLDTCLIKKKTIEPMNSEN